MLHDVGHYPFSHAFEDALNEYHADSIVIGEDDGNAGGDREPGGAPLKHEEVSKAVLVGDPTIRKLLLDAGIAPEDVARVFRREGDVAFPGLISSDLDADRIDYLLRTAKHTGLPYGLVDLDYLLKQLTLDNEGRLCFREKAMRTVEHLLIARYFDYQQVAFHKTVAAFEWLLRDLISVLLYKEEIRCSSEDIMTMIDTGSWSEFDDVVLLNLIRDLQQSDDSVVAAKAQALLLRDPPREVARIERLAERRPQDLERHAREVQAIEARVEEWAGRFDIDPRRWHVWDPKGLSLTKASPQISIAQAAGQEHGEERYAELQEAARILVDDGSSKPIWNIPASLMGVLGPYRPYTARLYVLFPPDALARRQEVSAAVRRDLSTIEWAG